MTPWPIRRDSHTTSDVLATIPQVHAVDIPCQSHHFRPVKFADEKHDSSSSESDLHPSRSRKAPRRPRHSRSISNPFPSFFTSGKKKKPDSYEEEASGSDDDDSGTSSQRRSKESSRRPSQRGQHARYASKDFTSGFCMTCGSSTRWPKELHTFRCTVCLTINDLVSRAHPEARDRSVGWPRGPATSSGQQSPTIQTSHTPPAQDPADPRSVKTISTHHTKWLVRQCLRSFLRSSLDVMENKEGLGLHSHAVHSEGHRSHVTIHSDKDVTNPVAVDMNRPGVRSLSATSPTYPPTSVFDESMLSPTSTTFDHANLRSYSSSYPERPSADAGIRSGSERRSPRHPSPSGPARPRIFKPLEDYIVASFSSFECVNSSFSTRRHAVPARSDSRPVNSHIHHRRRESAPTEPTINNLDPKMLMVGDIAENGAWWSGGQDSYFVRRAASQRQEVSLSRVSHRSPHMDWDELRDWYSTVINAAEGWRNVYNDIVSEHQSQESFTAPSGEILKDIEFELLTAQMHIQRVLLKATDNLLMRPGRPISEPETLRFLLITLHNPLLYPNPPSFRGWLQSSTSEKAPKTRSPPPRKMSARVIPIQYATIIKRILGLLSQSSVMCHNHIISWFARLPRSHFKQIKDLVAGFLTYRLLRPNRAKPELRVDITNGLVPSLGGSESTTAQLHAALGDNSALQNKGADQWATCSEDWQVRAAARVMAFLFAANNLPVSRRESLLSGSNAALEGQPTPRDSIQTHGQILPTSDFYNTFVDGTDLIADFETWESKRGFSFCQYPFLLSIAAKTRVLEHEARRQMLTKARDAFFDSILSRKNVNQFWVLDVRRDCLVEDSLKGVSEIIGSGSEDIKKSLRIAFAGEEGIDHGGLRKEWFLLLIREVFNLNNGNVSFSAFLSSIEFLRANRRA